MRCGEVWEIGDVIGGKDRDERQERFVREAGSVRVVNRRRDEIEGVKKFKRRSRLRLRLVYLMVEIMSVLPGAIIGFECLEPCWPGFRCWPHDDGDLEREPHEVNHAGRRHYTGLTRTDSPGENGKLRMENGVPCITLVKSVGWFWVVMR